MALGSRRVCQPFLYAHVLELLGGLITPRHTLKIALQLPILGSSGGGSKPPPSQSHCSAATSTGKSSPIAVPSILRQVLLLCVLGLPPIPTRHYKLESAAMGQEQDGWGGKRRGQERAAVYTAVAVTSLHAAPFRRTRSILEPDATTLKWFELVRRGSIWLPVVFTGSEQPHVCWDWPHAESFGVVVLIIFGIEKDRWKEKEYFLGRQQLAVRSNNDQLGK
ncbi:hypothetical protein B0H19DRAFT_1083757 [Mycena capillaripes]|nr:hypothetical protein B0H19DRAFT_1083757 [Mycena capillaripes]